jgi:hypothetical protein
MIPCNLDMQDSIMVLESTAVSTGFIVDEKSKLQKCNFFRRPSFFVLSKSVKDALSAETNDRRRENTGDNCSLVCPSCFKKRITQVNSRGVTHG